LNAKIGEFGGLSAILTRYRAQQMTLELSMTVPHHEPLVHKIVLNPSGVAYEIAEESLTQKRRPTPPPFKHIDSFRGDIRYYEVDQGGLIRPSWEHNPYETSLAQVPKMYREPEEFRSRLASSTFYHVLNVEPRAPVRLPQPLRPATLPGRDGEDLVPCLFNLRESDRDSFEAIEDALRVAFPGFERLDFPPVAAGTLAMTWRDSKFTRPFFMHQLSEGTLRFLWLVTLLQSPGLTAVTLLDEPEVSLHPELLSLLAGLMREASARTQLIVAPHAGRPLRFLRPNEVVPLDLNENGNVRANWGERRQLLA